MVRAIFYTHQTSGACAGVCACDRTYQMERTDKQQFNWIIKMGCNFSGQKMDYLNKYILKNKKFKNLAFEKKWKQQTEVCLA